MTDSSLSIQAVLFDFGGVLSVDPFRAMGAAATAIGLDPMEFAEIAIGRSTYGSGDHPWHRLERGEIELDEYDQATDALAKERGHGGFLPLPVDRVAGSVTQLHPEMLELLAVLRSRGIATAIVTNNIRALGAWRTTAAWDELVDLVVDSSDVGMRKPEARIFHHVCNALEVQPERALFLDDMQVNVDGASAAGLGALLVTDPSIAVAEVMRRLG